jgi:predicted ATPase
LTVLVGREEEIELVLRHWSRAKTGEGQVVSPSAEAVLGKLGLTVALMERVADEPHPRLALFLLATNDLRLLRQRAARL